MNLNIRRYQALVCVFFFLVVPKNSIYERYGILRVHNEQIVGRVSH